MKRVLSLLISLLMVFTLFTGCAQKEADVIKIGVFEPLTGENGGGGLQELDGVKYANKMYPEVLGKKIELVIVDNKSEIGRAHV